MHRGRQPGSFSVLVSLSLAGGCGAAPSPPRQGGEWLKEKDVKSDARSRATESGGARPFLPSHSPSWKRSFSVNVLSASFPPTLSSFVSDH